MWAGNGSPAWTVLRWQSSPKGMWRGTSTSFSHHHPCFSRRMTLWVGPRLWPEARSSNTLGVRNPRMVDLGRSCSCCQTAQTPKAESISPNAGAPRDLIILSNLIHLRCFYIASFCTALHPTSTSGMSPEYPWVSEDLSALQSQPA